MICSIVLAAGMSRRMGVQKLLLPFAEKTVIAHIVDQLVGAVDEVYVVTGHEEEKVAAELCSRAVSVVVNPEYEDGMLSSVRCGIRALPEDCLGVLVGLGDQPGITSELVNEMARAFESGDKGIVVPVCKDKRGHPLLFSGGYCDEILNSYDDVGLRGLLVAHPDDILELDVASTAVLADMDYPEDYRRELAILDEQIEQQPPSED